MAKGQPRKNRNKIRLSEWKVMKANRRLVVLEPVEIQEITEEGETARVSSPESSNRRTEENTTPTNTTTTAEKMKSIIPNQMTPVEHNQKSIAIGGTPKVDDTTTNRKACVSGN